MADESLPEVETKEIPGTNGAHRIGKDGSVWTCLVPGHRTKAHWRQLRPRPVRGGYLAIRIRIDGAVRSLSVHRLVLEAFEGNCPDGMECLHENDNRQDNRIGNLKWGTRQENLCQRCTTGNQQRGERVGTSKLNSTQVHEIRRRLKAGETAPAIARHFGVTPTAVFKIKKGVNWSHLKDTSEARETAYV